MGITIDRGKCSKCGKCAERCPCGVFEQKDPGQIPNIAREDGCMTCGHCMLGCPANAVSVPGLSYDMVHEVGAMPNAAQVASLISGRRSVRRFIDRPVEKEVVEQVLALAAMAPTARNCQSTEFHVITDKKRVSVISSMTAEDLRKLTQMMNGSFGRLMVRMAMGREMYPAVEEIQPMVRYIVGEYEKGIDAVLYNTPVLISFHADPTLAMANENAQLAMQNALLALPVLDLGGFYSGFVPVMAQRNRRLVASLGVPEGHKLYGVLAFGYDGEKTDRYMERRPKVTWQ